MTDPVSIGPVKWRNAALVSVLAMVLCGLGVYIAASHSANVDELVASGRRVLATVTETHRKNRSIWSQIEYRVNGELYTVRLRSPSHTVLPRGETVLVYVDPDDPLRVTTEEGDATFTPPVGPEALFGLGTAVILIYICVAGTSIWRDKWAATSEVHVKAPAISRNRGVIRRTDLIARMMAGLVALFPLAAWIGGNFWSGTAVAAPLFVLFALMGWGRKVVVTRDSVEAYSLTQRTTVPRWLIREVAPYLHGLVIRLHYGGTATVGVGMSEFWSKIGPDPRDYRAAQLKTMARLNALLEALPDTSSSAQGAAATTKPRYLPMVLLAASAFLPLVVFFPPG